MSGTTATWKDSNSGDWGNASNWESGIVPNSGSIDVVLPETGGTAYIVSIGNGESFAVLEKTEDHSALGGSAVGID